MPSVALLLVGEATHPSLDCQFYANDVLLWRSLLETRFGIQREHILSLYEMGGVVSTSMPVSSFNARPATRDELERAFAQAQTLLAPGDTFFFVVSNHGDRAKVAQGRTQPSVIVLAPPRSKSSLSPDELRAHAERLPSQKQLYIFGQCGAGGFASVAGPGRAVLAACRENQPAYIRKDDPRGRNWQWSEFLFNLAAALGAETDGPPPCPILRDAFLRAERLSTHRKDSDDGEWPLLVDPDDITSSIRAV